MAEYYLNLSGSETAPYDTLEKGANSWTFLSNSVVFSDGDIVWVRSGIYSETNDTGTVAGNISVRSLPTNSFEPIFMINQGVSANIGFLRTDVFGIPKKIDVYGIVFWIGTYDDPINGSVAIVDCGGTKQGCTFLLHGVSNSTGVISIQTGMPTYPIVVDRCKFLNPVEASYASGVQSQIFNMESITITNNIFVGMSNAIFMVPNTIIPIGVYTVANNSCYRLKASIAFGSSFFCYVVSIGGPDPNMVIANNIIDGGADPNDKTALNLEFATIVHDYNTYYQLTGPVNVVTGPDIPFYPHDLVGVDPLYIDRSNANLRLLPGSPCIDAGAGTGVYSTVPVVDIEGISRPIVYGGDHVPVDNGTDMGAYEMTPIPSPTPTAPTTGPAFGNGPGTRTIVLDDRLSTLFGKPWGYPQDFIS